MRRGGVQTIAPNTLLFDRAPAKEEETLNRVAIALLQYSPHVVPADEAAVLIDVYASLRLFGGIRKLRRRMRRTVETMGFSCWLGCAPTAQGAWLLAAAGGGTALSPASLARQLASLPAGLLPAARAHRDWFDGLGCRTLGQIRQLARAGLQRRCGDAINDALDRALGEAPEIFDWLQTPASFTARVELPDRIEHAEATLAYANSLIAQLIGWLTARQLALTRFVVALEHERGREALAPTEIDIALAEPAWHDEHLTRLLRERLARLEVAAAMIAVRLTVTDVQPMAPPSETLFPEPGGKPEDHARVMELLVARLGAEHVLKPATRADYRPEHANAWVPITEAAAPVPPPSGLPRPAWLLAKPVALLTRNNRPFYGSPLRLVSPPERIEAGWWDGQLVTRDYFVAEGGDHSHYWIYQERLGSRDGDAVRWYLHGLFG
ncbi:protein ImuB [Cupriavidus gilardii J11]|uniref:Protein ImuB n=1 Tax=Cupriavidus gilardii J11 TaxID=936133 RepID=A0A562BRU6_9BURK|nr:protein ImuB [Cupriavidus gilardii J11]